MNDKEKLEIDKDIEAIIIEKVTANFVEDYKTAPDNLHRNRVDMNYHIFIGHWTSPNKYKEYITKYNQLKIIK